jgi:hypothetical protein
VPYWPWPLASSSFIDLGDEDWEAITQTLVACGFYVFYYFGLYKLFFININISGKNCIGLLGRPQPRKTLKLLEFASMA